MELNPEDEDFFVEVGFASLDSGQFIFEPPNVAGWPGYRAWITTASIQSRWGSLGFYAYYEDAELTGLLNTVGLRVTDRAFGNDMGLDGTEAPWIIMRATKNV